MKKIILTFLLMHNIIHAEDIYPISKTKFKSENGKIYDLYNKDFIVVYINYNGVGSFYAVDKDGTTWKTGRITGGASGFLTSNGFFRIYHKKRYHMSTKYPDPNGINNMDFSMFFNGGQALHKGNVRSLSHGCVHVAKKDIEVLYKWAKNGTPVIVTDTDYKPFAMDDLQKIYGGIRYSKIYR